MDQMCTTKMTFIQVHIEHRWMKCQDTTSPTGNPLSCVEAPTDDDIIKKMEDCPSECGQQHFAQADGAPFAVELLRSLVVSLEHLTHTSFVLFCVLSQ